MGAYGKKIVIGKKNKQNKHFSHNVSALYIVKPLNTKVSVNSFIVHTLNTNKLTQLTRYTRRERKLLCKLTCQSGFILLKLIIADI